MSAKTIKASAWPHKSPARAARTTVEMVKIFRNATHVFTRHGALTREGYELTRLAHPDLQLPRFDDLPLRETDAPILQ